MAEVPSSEQPCSPPSPPTILKHSSNHPVHQTLASAANLDNLLPTGTVLAFHTLIPTFSNNGSCQFPMHDIFNCSNAEDMDRDLKKHRIRFIDFVHAFMSLLVFLVIDLSNSSVQSSFSELGISELTMNLPLGAGNLSSFLFTIFPTTCKGIGRGDMVPRHCSVSNSNYMHILLRVV
ncbi:hypothetical protein ACFXTH_010368 [Malus domestica]